MKLSPEQLSQFDEQGYLFLPDCFSDEEVAVLRAEAEEIYKSDREEVWRESPGAPRFGSHFRRGQRRSASLSLPRPRAVSNDRPRGTPEDFRTVRRR